MERYILEALQKATITAVNPTALPVKYLGRTFNPPSDGRWVEVLYFPNNVENEFLGDSKTYRGFFRLILHWGIDDAGVYTALEKAQEIANGFAKGSKFADLGNNVSVKIYDTPDISSVIEEAPELLIPITIRYIYFKA